MISYFPVSVLPLLLWMCIGVLGVDLLVKEQNLTVLQASNLAVYEIESLSNLSANSLLELEIQVPHSASVALTLRKNRAPVLTANGDVEADLVDYSGWLSNKTTHSLTFTKDFASSAECLFVGVAYFESQPGLVPILYTLEFRSSDTALCPSNCTGRGKCVKDTCRCDPGYFDIDCSYAPTALVANQTLHIPINQSLSCYVKTSSDSTQLTLRWVGSSIDFLSKSWKVRSFHLSPLPSYYEADTISLNISSPFEADLPSDGQYALVLLVNTGPTHIDLEITASTSDSGDQSKVYIVAICCAGGLTTIVVWGLYIYFKIRRGANTAVIPTEVWSISRPQFLSIIQLFPEEVFSALPCDRVNRTCAICLEHFFARDTVRYLLCGHVYHSQCIDRWFTNHDVTATQFCCVCKRDYSNLEAVKEEVERFHSTARADTSPNVTFAHTQSEKSDHVQTPADDSEITVTRME